MSRIEEILSDAKDTMTVSRVYGEPYESNGVTLIPAATVKGGLGSGEGEGSMDTPAGRGGGFGVSARPVGAYQITGSEVKWIPAVDVSRVVLMGQVVAIVALLAIRSILRRKKR
jgi:uncharacterized spore protein YtfJ